MKRVFISYAHEDQEFARRLAEDLGPRVEHVWIDTRIEHGHAWSKEIEDELEASDTLLLVVSPHAKDSSYVRKEVLFAMENGTHVIPLIHRKRRWALIVDLQYVDFTLYDEGFAKLVNETPPRRTLRRWLLFLWKRAREFRAVATMLAIAAAVAAAYYFFSPSDTTLTFHGAGRSGILFHAENRGGRPSVLLGSPLRIDFGALPIEAEELTVVEPAKGHIPGHYDDTIRLMVAEIPTPKLRADGSWSTIADVRARIPASIITITGQLKESGRNPVSIRIQRPASQFQPFIEKVFPEP